ncbi:6,7-dimethyl-8-ribityllumazine synthase [Abditibacterium utsteinense]|uniref:6,7-dimethyl-8-ribityllumazine synthase n=1 Tax=Abditibacterium utsteinense TaxID=1960156 RepID=A0A2S8SVN6_9BACT|nr:6,7-dimethyl-8-ribityllumazine synthase [Abditibacterium utsteinense]PQV64866.1 6,7-dimethyl-8-ribityllumazine synthase [Abditibacterium utsteinense]
MTIHEGRILVPDGSPQKIGIVVSRFNELITEKLLEGAVSTFKRAGGHEDKLEIARVPGAFELPIVAQKMAQSGQFAAIICLGCVIRGATTHYDYVCNQTASGIMNVGLSTGIPTIFGVVTTENLEQAFERAGSKSGNKGADAMQAALETADLLARL